MNKEEQKKRKLLQKTVYFSYEQEAYRLEHGLKTSDFSNYGYKKMKEEKLTAEEVKLEIEIDVYEKQLEDLLEKVEDVKDKIEHKKFMLQELRRLSPEVKEKVFSEMKELFIEFEEEYSKYYEEHPEKTAEKIESFYSNKDGSIFSIGRKYNLTEEEVVSIYEELLATEEALAEAESVLNAKPIKQ